MVTISDDILNQAALTEKEFMCELAVMLYARRYLTFGKARSLTEMDIFQFQDLLAERNVPMHYGVIDLEKDWQTILAMEP